jgi:hypothetical protein
VAIAKCMTRKRDSAGGGYGRRLRSRVRFQGERSGAPFPSAVVVFGPLPRTAWWDVSTGELHCVDVQYRDRTVHTRCTHCR